MKLRDPKVTITNTDGKHWLVSVDGLLSDADGMEAVNFTVLVPRSDKSLPAVTKEAVARVIQLLQGYVTNSGQ